MYTEEPRRRIDWGNVLRKIVVLIIIVLIVLLIIWLFNRSNYDNNINKKYNNNNTKLIDKNKNNNDDNNSNNNNSGLQNPNLYSESFVVNYKYFHDTARDFVEKNNLPALNKSVKYTLGELIEKDLMLPTSYGNTMCDTDNSYAIVTNDNGVYTMTTTLVCGSEIAKTTEVLKCSLLCGGNCNTDLTKLEYEFKQSYNATETIYSCQKGYTKTGSGSNTRCVKSDSSIIKPTKNVDISCPSGYNLNADKTKCTAGSTTTTEPTITTSYSCSEYGSSYKLSGTNCVKTSTITKDAKPNTTYSCANGSTPNSNHMCPSTSTTYKCSEGDLVNTRYCRIYTTSSYYQSYNIFHGNTYNGCTYSGSSTTPCTDCAGSTRTVYNYYCKKTSYSDAPATEVTSTVYTTPAIKKTTYSCDSYGSGYKLNSDNKCVKTTTDTKPAKKITTKKCANGTLKDGKCVIDTTSTVNPSKNISYTCPSDYRKEGLAESAICVKGSTSTVAPTKSTKSVTKYRYKWSSETSLSGWTRTGKTRTVKAS